MTYRLKLWTSFVLILLLAALGSVVSWPNGPDIRNPQTKDLIREAKVHLGLDLQGGSHLEYQADVSKIPSADQESAISAARDVIERRVNTFGVSEPVVQTNKAGDDWRVIVELPGIQDINAAIDRIGKTPLLEFREEPEKTAEDEANTQAEIDVARTTAESVLSRALAGEDFASLAKELSEDTISAENGGDLDFQRREAWVPEFADAVFDKATKGEVYPELVATTFGFHILKVTDERTVQEEGIDIREVRASHILIKTPQDDSTGPLAIFGYINTKLSGQHLKRADVQFDQTTSEPQVVLSFNDEGSTLFAEITKKNIGKQVAIFLDGSPISAPVVQQEITGGQAVISGGFAIDEAKELAQNLNSGALPVPIKLVSQQNIGATLGELALQKSFVGGIIGFIALIIFMVGSYRVPGVLAVCALAIYSVIVMSIFKLIPVTLTLAGIAGFILSIGMAVDANVLIFERMREEKAAGKSKTQALEDGFKRAWLSIRDSNISSIITCIILAWFGTSLVKGFAITLAIGILVSMFSAISITRTFLRLVARSRFAKWI